MNELINYINALQEKFSGEARQDLANLNYKNGCSDACKVILNVIQTEAYKEKSKDDDECDKIAEEKKGND